MTAAEATAGGTATPAPAPAAAGRTEGPRIVAVIDIGTNSIRLNIGELHPNGDVVPIDALQQPVTLGKDSFTKGSISQDSITQAVAVLKRFRGTLAEYQVTRAEQIRAVATSAVREALNREAFVDRVFIATGIDVDVIDAAEQTRLTYQSILPYIASEHWLRDTQTVAIEVGGGGTELLWMRGHDVLFSHTYRMGSLRLREMLEQHRVSDARLRQLMERHIDMTIEQVLQNVALEETPHLLILGGEARLAASAIVADWEERRVARVPVAQLARFVDEILDLPIDELVRRFRLLYPEAETLGPTLLTYLRLARAGRFDHVVVCKATMREGLLIDMATQGRRSEQFFAQVVHAAVELGRKYEFDEAHARHVADLGRTLFDAMRGEHQLGPRHEAILYIAALLHEIGLFVSLQSHHKHSMYLIMNSELFGMGRRDLQLAALVARYHRRAEPQPQHEGYALLGRDDRVAVVKLAAMLRVADALDRSHSQRVRDARWQLGAEQLTVAVPGIDDFSLEQLALQQKGDMFTKVYGRRIALQRLDEAAAANAS